jgi:hypothetical protein
MEHAGDRVNSWLYGSEAQETGLGWRHVETAVCCMEMFTCKCDYAIMELDYVVQSHSSVPNNVSSPYQSLSTHNGKEV